MTQYLSFQNNIVLFQIFKISYGAESKPITKTRLYNFDPLKPHFYIVKLEFTGVYIIFLNSAQKHRLCTHNPCFEQKYEKYQSFSSENFQFLEVNFFIYLNRRVFVMPSAFFENLRAKLNNKTSCIY